MSELKRNTEFQFGTRERPESVSPGIEDSQPRQTLELKRAMAFLTEGEDAGCDPYNSLGTRPIKTRAA